jgi:antitoxin ChpS
MLTSTLRTVGGSIMLAIPKSVLDGLGLAANEKVELRLDEGRLVIEPRRRPKYTLEELVAQCAVGEAQEEMQEWDEAAPVGREII